MSQVGRDNSGLENLCHKHLFTKGTRREKYL